MANDTPDLRQSAYPERGYQSPFRSQRSAGSARLAIPLVSGRHWDRKSSPHSGRGSALRVPVSQGPGSTVLDRGKTSQQALIAQEPSVEPSKLMEAKTGAVLENRERR